jgi:hypothetical protein
MWANICTLMFLCLEWILLYGGGSKDSNFFLGNGTIQEGYGQKKKKNSELGRHSPTNSYESLYGTLKWKLWIILNKAWHSQPLGLWIVHVPIPRPQIIHNCICWIDFQLLFSLWHGNCFNKLFQARRVWKFWLGVIVATTCNQNKSVALTREDMVSLSSSIYILWKINVLG